MQVHVPKNGGGSADVFFRGCAGVYVAFAQHALGIKSVLDLSRTAVVVLRDPADRVISEYQWGRLNFGKDYDDGHHLIHTLGNDTAPPRVWKESDMGPLIMRAYHNSKLKPQHTYFAGVASNDRRVRVLCMDRLAEGLAQVAEEACAGGLASFRAREVPRLHRTQSPKLEQASSSRYTMTDGLRKMLNKVYATDAQLYARHCGNAGLNGHSSLLERLRMAGMPVTRILS